MELESIGSMGGTIFLVFAAVCIVFAALMGLKRGVFKSAVRTVSLFVSALVSLFLVKMILPSLLKMLTNTVLEQFLGGNGLVEDLMKAESAFTALEALIVAFIAPLAFVLVYFIVNKLFLIVCFIVNTATKSTLGVIEKKIPCRRLFGALISILGAIVTLAVVATPFGGYVETIDHIKTSIVEVQDENAEENEMFADLSESLDEISPLTHGIADSVAVSIPYKMGGCLFYDSLTSIHIAKNSGIIDEDIKTSLEDEVIGVLEFIPVIGNLDEMQFADVGNMNIDPLKNIANVLKDEDSSDVVRVLLADIFATASTEWLAGNSYLSINLKDMLSGEAEMFWPSVEVILLDLSNTHVSDVGDNIITLVETFDGIQQTFLYMTKIANSIGSGENVNVDDVVEMLKNLTPQAAKAMSASMTPIMTQTGIGDENAQALSGILTASLEEMATLTQSGSDEEIEKEAAALNTVLSLAMDPNAEMSDEKADELIDTVMDSSILANSIKAGINDAEEEGAPSMVLPEASANLVYDKIDSYAAENDLNDDQKETLEALRSFFVVQGTVEG